MPQGYLDRFFEEYRQCSVFSQMFDLITPTWFQGLRPTDLPSALLWGEAERLLAVEQIDDYRALLPRATIRRVPGWGHFPMIERPDEYAAEIAGLARPLLRSTRLGLLPPPRARGMMRRSRVRAAQRLGRGPR